MTKKTKGDISTGLFLLGAIMHSIGLGLKIENSYYIVAMLLVWATGLAGLCKYCGK